MLVAYFDESGTHGEAARVTTVAGLVGDSREWARLEYEWRKRLGQIKCFHATDCAAGDGEFRGLSVEDRRDLSINLAKIIASSGDRLVAVGGAVYRDDWNYAVSDIIKAQFHTRYHFCLSMALMQVSELSLKHADGDPVAYVFAKHDEYGEYAQTIHEVFSKSKTLPIGHMGFGEPKCVVPLQMADLYAYENYKELLTQLDEPGLRVAKREQLQIIHKGIFNDSRIATVGCIHAIATDFEESITASPEKWTSRAQ